MYILPPDDAMDLLAKARTYGELDEMEAKQLLIESGMYSPSRLSLIGSKLARCLSRLLVSIGKRLEQFGADKSVCQSDQTPLCCEGKLR